MIHYVYVAVGACCACAYRGRCEVVCATCGPSLDVCVCVREPAVCVCVCLAQDTAAGPAITWDQFAELLSSDPSLLAAQSSDLETLAAAPLFQNLSLAATTQVTSLPPSLPPFSPSSSPFPP